MNLADEKECRLCLNGNENILHFLKECDDDIIRKSRDKIFKMGDLTKENLSSIEPLKLLKFAKDTKMYKCFTLEN